MQGIDSGSVITLGTGIGGSVILDGRLYRGRTFAAGEYSGLAADLSAKYTKGRSWANISSTKALVRNYAEAIGKDPSEVDGRIFFEAVNSNDETALNVLEHFCDTVITGIMTLQLTLDVRRYAIGGGISARKEVTESIRKGIDKLFSSGFAFPFSKPEIVTCTFGNDANLIGALSFNLSRK